MSLLAEKPKSPISPFESFISNTLHNEQSGLKQQHLPFHSLQGLPGPVCGLKCLEHAVSMNVTANYGASAGTFAKSNQRDENKELQQSNSTVALVTPKSPTMYRGRKIRCDNVIR